MNEWIHIGKLIQNKMEEQGRKVSWLANKVNCRRDNIYKLFSKPSTDTLKLLNISLALETNFFEYLSKFYNEMTNLTDNIDVKRDVVLYDKKDIGKLIKNKLDEGGRKIVWLAKKIHCKERNIYNIFDRESIDIELLFKVSLALKTNFFIYLSDLYKNMLK